MIPCVGFLERRQTQHEIHPASISADQALQAAARAHPWFHNQLTFGALGIGTDSDG
jgi:hypothetical protein